MLNRFVTLPFRPAKRPVWYGPAGYLATIGGLTLATAVMHALLSLVTIASTYLVYLVIVVAVSVGWGLKQGILASVLGFLAANFFFTQPVFTFTVAAIQDVIALITFLSLATLSSQLVARLRREARDARQSEQTTATLYALSQTLTGQQSRPGTLEEVAAQLRAALNLTACSIILTEPGDTGTASAVAPTLVGEHPESNTVVRMPLLVGGKRYGLLQLTLPPARRSLTRGEQRMVAAFTTQLQMALERDRLHSSEIEAEVLRRTDALRAALLSAVAHDLRTPLTSIKSAATGLLSTHVEWSKSEQQGFLKAIVQEVDRINRIVGNLLDISLIEAGRMQPHKELHHIEDVITTVTERLSPELHNHPLSIEIEANLPAIPIDDIQIDEVLTNLLENAIKYTPTATPVEVRACRHGDLIRIEVADQGPGIPPEHFSQLFNRFYRVTVDSAGAGQVPRGTGLGLAIVKAIVEAHGGQVGAANAPEEGAVFWFTLPICSVERHEAADGPLLSHIPTR
ncbi:MAG: ATP-binding protein [Chloroflexota bacterium]